MQNLRLTGLYYHEGSGADKGNWCRWNFILSNGQESAIKNDSVMVKHTLPDKPIRKVQMIVGNNSDYPSLQGLKFFDEKNVLIYEIGKHDKSYLVKEVLLKEDERIVGFWSTKRLDGYAGHFDLQLMIATLN